MTGGFIRSCARMEGAACIHNQHAIRPKPRQLGRRGKKFEIPKNDMRKMFRERFRDERDLLNLKLGEDTHLSKIK